MEHKYILDLRQLSSADIATAGGKAANLGALGTIEGINVPPGFCINTEAFVQVLQRLPQMDALLDRLAYLHLDDRKDIAVLATGIRQLIEAAELPEGLEDEMARHLDTAKAYAVRSSATAEDLPSASFAGQQDSYLNIRGRKAVLEHISKCWASLFTERAILYRIRNGFDHRQVTLAVIVQEMIFPQASGILFTADPVTGKRNSSIIDAGFGLGETLVSGIVSADQYIVQETTLVRKTIATKKHQVSAMANGGTEIREPDLRQQTKQVLTDTQILELAALGRQIEAYFGRPQDIEWSLSEGLLYILQSRPITTLFPVPEQQDQEPHVYISVGHNQMMTDAMKPLGLSFFLMTTRAPMSTAGGRLFVDVAKNLATASGRKQLIGGFGKTDHLISAALEQVAERIPLLPEDQHPQLPKKNTAAALPGDPGIVAELIRKNEASVAALEQKIRNLSGLAVFDCIKEDLEELKRIAFDPQSSALIMAAMDAALWLNEKMLEWLGEKNAADILAQSVPHNITAQMGWDLMDVADGIRPYPQIVAYLQQTMDDDFIGKLPQFEGGTEVRKAIQDFLDRYGMRCTGEIDITRARWTEKPSTLIPALLSNIRIFTSGESRRKYEQGLQEALHKKEELLVRLLQLPGAAQKVKETREMIDRLHYFSGYREYPKYGIVSRYFIYKQALLKNAEQLAGAGVLQQREDCYFLSFEEFREVLRTQKADQALIERRKEAFLYFEKLNPPRVMTEKGEIITGSYKKEQLPEGAIAALPVSSGIVEGRARVILDMKDAVLEEGDILVTRFTDPSWTPLFVSIKGLVTEVGGLMTHGAVIAREYGLPAVVGAENATQLIRDGQRIRVNGTEGYVELLS